MPLYCDNPLFLNPDMNKKLDLKAALISLLVAAIFILLSNYIVYVSGLNQYPFISLPLIFVATYVVLVVLYKRLSSS